ncbi:2-amino-4-hydroxy-6-hydroxymethyldihydropteridinediphosphokinase [Soonwooa buanensis]|uniref:2-amino-4-hydroxy-6-hydroxymethyldihydropteridine pyrophosphokinase n=1 Tax=Soonwooa buanensis TaxID=619805 RepID=A0A1T5GQ45_9FLAO|nr:2-amino-4-hydroxy-6-hydroxymethyldihydropteridine diphosphokinase [Soonwooa buanensis]SKC10501.1 2-amino-4-hydroxy-6-hydroxymethyldihydropteridinediphosphokinase [Soonwooa buanensis]
MSQHVAVLLLGSNKNNPKIQIENAISKIVNSGCTIVNMSKIMETSPIEFDSSNNFCNIALRINTSLSPFKLLKSMKAIEIEMGRIQDSRFFGEYKDREIDIDIVFYDNIFFECENLSIPHIKHVYERDFSKQLIAEIVT